MEKTKSDRLSPLFIIAYTAMLHRKNNDKHDSRPQSAMRHSSGRKSPVSEESIFSPSKLSTGSRFKRPSDSETSAKNLADETDHKRNDDQLHSREVVDLS